MVNYNNIKSSIILSYFIIKYMFVDTKIKLILRTKYTKKKKLYLLNFLNFNFRSFLKNNFDEIINYLNKTFLIKKIINT